MRRIALAADESASRAARPGQHPDGDVGGEPHVAGTRGKWVLENVLGAPPPQPPPGVETNLEKDAAQVKVTSLRQRMELHRANPACASCHRLMDPIGFALENFDNTGKWRTLDGKTPIDATGAAGRRHAAQRPGDAAPGAAGEVGRVRRRVRRAAADLRHRPRACGRRTCRPCAPSRAPPRTSSYRFSSFVLGVVQTPPFQMQDEGAARYSGPRSTDRMFITKKHLSRRTFLQRHRRHGCAAAARLDGRRRRRRCARAPRRRRRASSRFYVPHGATMDKWTPATRGHRLRVHRDPQAARAVPRPHQHRQRPGASVRGGRGRRRRLGRREPHARGGGVSHRRGPGARRAGASRRVGRPGGGAAHRSGHAAAVAGALDRRSRARLRGVVQLRLPQLDLVEVADASRCRCTTTRGWCSRSCSASARPTRSGARGARKRAACSIR